MFFCVLSVFSLVFLVNCCFLFGFSFVSGLEYAEKQSSKTRKDLSRSEVKLGKGSVFRWFCENVGEVLGRGYPTDVHV